MAVSFEFAVLRIKGKSDGAPSAYLQAALHGGELPGVVAIDALMPKLRAAEAEGRVLGDITIVPAANPIGRAQYLFGELQGASIWGRGPISTAISRSSSGRMHRCCRMATASPGPISG